MAQTPRSVTRRERQILDLIYRKGTATAADIHAALPDAPTYTAVRGLLRVMVRKGLVRFEREGRRYVYLPSTPRSAAGAATIRHVVKTFFEGSPSAAMTALIGSEDGPISDEELKRLDELVMQMRKRRGGGR